MSEYVILIEEGATSFGATCPDLPGVFAVADSREEVVELMREAVREHIQLLAEAGQPVPAPVTKASLITVAA